MVTIQKSWYCSHLICCFSDANIPMRTFAQHPFGVVKGRLGLTGTLKAPHTILISGLSLGFVHTWVTYRWMAHLFHLSKQWGVVTKLIVQAQEWRYHSCSGWCPAGVRQVSRFLSSGRNSWPHFNNCSKLKSLPVVILFFWSQRHPSSPKALWNLSPYDFLSPVHGNNQNVWLNTQAAVYKVASVSSKYRAVDISSEERTLSEFITWAT